MRKGLALALLLGLGALPLFSQAPPPQGPGSALDPGPASGEGAKALRRFEIIALGSFPLSLLYTNFGFDLGGYAASGFDSSHAPWPFASERSSTLSDGDRLLRIGVAAGLSLGIAALDALLLPRARARRAAARGLGPLPPESPGAPAPSLPAGPGSALPAYEPELDSAGGSD